jgi:signal transduction histidine kinase
MQSAEAVLPVPEPPRIATAGRGVHSPLSRRLMWLTVAAVLIAEALFFLPSLARVRHIWLERRLREGQLAALAAGTGPVSDAMRDNLLRLAGIEAVALRGAGYDITLTRSDGMPQAGQILDMHAESVITALAGAVAGLFRASDPLLRIEGRSFLGDGGLVTVVVHRHDLDQELARHLRRVGLLSLLVATAAGILIYGALVALLVRPMRRLTAGISAFRADPERAAAFDAPGSGDDEIAVAGRELAAMQRELRAALWRNARLAALGTAVAKINHDLRGILSPALLTAERLQMNQDPAIKRAGDTLVRAVERATELVRRTVEYAREVPLAPRRERMRLRTAIEEAAEQARLLCPQLEVVDAVAETVEIEAEPESIVRVLSNLLRNAGEAKARHVRISAAEEAGGIVVTVSDDGPGLPPSVQEALFRPFIPGGRPGSTGLGLAIVRDLVRAHGGEVTLLKTGPSGTSFRLTLPRPSRIAAPRAPAEAGS